MRPYYFEVELFLMVFTIEALPLKQRRCDAASMSSEFSTRFCAPRFPNTDTNLLSRFARALCLAGAETGRLCGIGGFCGVCGRLWVFVGVCGCLWVFVGVFSLRLILQGARRKGGGRKRVKTYSCMQQTAAHARVKALVLEQILAGGASAGQASQANQANQANQAVDGDAAARKLFWTLLYPHQQRQLFLELYRDRRFWPRIKTVVGSPPFSFLRPEESQMLNAGAIRHRRSNMAHEEANATSSSAEIGDGHFVDGSGRKLRIVDRSDRSGGTLPFGEMEKGVRLVCDLKIPRMSSSSRLEIAKKRLSPQSSAFAKISFPRINELVRVSPTALVEAELRGTGGGLHPYGQIEIQVKGVVQRGQQSPVCRMFAVVV